MNAPTLPTRPSTVQRIALREIPEFLRAHAPPAPQGRLASAEATYRAACAVVHQVIEALHGAGTAGERLDLADALADLHAQLGRDLFGPEQAA